jgi:hypothetical protein
MQNQNYKLKFCRNHTTLIYQKVQIINHKFERLISELADISPDNIKFNNQ